jgi:hypothetical protein
MTIKITPAIMMAMALITIAPNARAEIASKAYVDEQGGLLLHGQPGQLTANDLRDLSENGGISGMLDNYVLSEQLDHYPLREETMALSDQSADAIVVTDSEGQVKLATGAPINNAKISSDAGIELGKLAFPTPPTICETKGCMLMYYDGKYVWETVTRDTGETIATTGYVSATPVATTTTMRDVNEAIDPQEACEASGGHWNSTKGICS